jgi:hypothetical protein
LAPRIPVSIPSLSGHGFPRDKPETTLVAVVSFNPLTVGAWFPSLPLPRNVRQSHHLSFNPLTVGAWFPSFRCVRQFSNRTISSFNPLTVGAWFPSLGSLYYRNTGTCKRLSTYPLSPLPNRPESRVVMSHGVRLNLLGNNHLPGFHASPCNYYAVGQSHHSTDRKWFRIQRRE